jgi:hypothetical protein
MTSRITRTHTQITKNCNDLRAANRTLMRDMEQDAPALAGILSEIRSIEDATVALLDPNQVSFPFIQQAIRTSGSLQLVEHLHGHIGKLVTLDEADWLKLFDVVDLRRVRELTNGPCASAFISAALLRHIHQGRTDLVPLIDEVAQYDICPTLNGAFNCSVPHHAARLLRLQVQRLPMYFHNLAINAARQMAVDSLALYFLLGAKMPLPEESYNEGSHFLEVLTSNHGQMFARKTLGTVEEFIADPKRIRRSSRVSKHALSFNG